METEGLSFLESVEALARQAGLQMPQNDLKSAENARRQATLIDVTQAAATWFGEQLTKSHAAKARSYLEKRGVSDALVREFGWGLQRARRGLVEYLQARDGQST